MVQDIVQQMLRAKTGRSCKYFESLHLSKDGAKPQQEYSPEQRSGYGCKSKLARCKRKRKNEPIPIHQQNCMQSAHFFLPFALSERKIDVQLYPERCSGLYSFWAFSPSLLKCNSPYLLICNHPYLLKCNEHD